MLRKAIYMIGVVALIVSGAMATPIVIDEWDDAETGWGIATSLGDAGAISITSGTGNPADSLEIIGGQEVGSNEDRISNDGTGGGDAGLFVGNWASAGVASILFDFYVPTGQDGPIALSLYFDNGTYLWYYTLTAPTTGSGWTSLYADVLLSFAGEPVGWVEDGDDHWSYTDFLNDMTTVSEVGIILRYQDSVDNQVFGIDNFELNNELVIPEPATYVVLATAFLSLGITFRRRIKDSVSKLFS